MSVHVEAIEGLDNGVPPGGLAIVTGGACGIGRAVAQLLGQQGWRVAIFDIDETLLASARSQLESIGVDCTTHVVDVSASEQVESAVESASRAWGPVGVLVNSAAIYELADIADLDGPAFVRMLSVNVIGTFSATRSVLISMTGRKRGAIVSVSSLAGLRGQTLDSNRNGGASHYAASKGAVVAFTRSVAGEVARLGIRAKVVAPGMIRTAMTAAYSDAAIAAYRDSIPLGRLGTPEDVAEVVGFLASKKASYVTGQTFNICGGAMIS